MLTLSSKPLVATLNLQLEERVRAFHRKTHRLPRLAVVLVGADPASVIYTRRKGETAIALGMEHETINLPVTAMPHEVKSVVDRLNQDPLVDGILVQRPLPQGFREEEVLYWVAPEKDVDAFHPVNAGRLLLGLPCFRPCTPSGVMLLLAHYGIQTRGKVACVIGRSSIVGKPMASLLLQADATVLHCHTKTHDLAKMTRQADILVVAAGKPGLIGPEHVGDGAVVIDVGVHRTAEGKLVGDVRFAEVAPKTSAMTPVPGGVGPMTISVLLQNTLMAAEWRSGLIPGH